MIHLARPLRDLSASGALGRVSLYILSGGTPTAMGRLFNSHLGNLNVSSQSSSPKTSRARGEPGPSCARPGRCGVSIRFKGPLIDRK